MGNLLRFEAMLGCDTTVALTAPLDTAVSDPVRPTSIGPLSSIREIATFSVGFLILLGFGGFCLLFVANRLVLGRRSPRKICRTPMLISYGDQCTVTHIVDINRQGMKIEAAQKQVENPWFDLHFCGHKIQGKIAWRNKYYARIKFRTRISNEVLNDVIEKSGSPLGDSGLAKNATPCFSVGCHTSCPRHLPTAISEEP